jgi:cysteine-S-conjugate beta-lyase
MKYDFDTIIDRMGTSSSKWSYAKQYCGYEDVLPMWVADMDFATAPEIVEAIKARAAHPIYGYTSKTEGYFQGMINWMAKRNGWKGIKKEWLLSSPGVVPGFNYCVQAYSHPGDKVIIQPPVYYPFRNAILNNGRQVVDNPLKIKDGYYYMDFEDLEKKIDARTKMLIFCSPHNPVGRVWKKDELKQLMEILEKKNIIMISDEIHSDLILGKTKHTCTATVSDDALMRTVTLTAPNKTFNIAGLQNADAIIPNEKLRAAFLNVTQNNSVSNPNLFGIVAQEAAYAKGEPWLEELLKYLKGNLAFFEEYVKKNMPMLKVYPLEGTYLAWVDCSGLGMDEATLHTWMLEKARLWLDDGVMFGAEGSLYMRFNIACPRAMLKDGLDRLNKAVKELPKKKK